MNLKSVRKHRQNTVEEEHGILIYNELMFSLPHFHVHLKSVNICTILTSEVKTCVGVLAITWKIYFLHGI